MSGVLSRLFLWFLSALLMGCVPQASIKVGLLANLTGPLSDTGLGGRRSLDLVIRDLNRGEEIHGQRVELLAGDAHGQGGALAAVVELQRRGVVAVIDTAEGTEADILTFVTQHQLPTITSSGGLPSKLASGWLFSVGPKASALGRTLGDYAAQRGLTDLAVLRETSNDAYTGPLLQAVRERVRAAGGEVRKAVEFDMRETSDFSALAKALGSAPAYLFLTNGSVAAQVGQALARAGNLGPILAPAWTMTRDVIALGGRQVERMVFVSAYDSQNQNPVWRAFHDGYLGSFGEEPDSASVAASDAFSVLADALRISPSTKPGDLSAALTSVDKVSGLATFHRRPDGEVGRDLFLSTVRDGKFVRNDP